MMMIKKISMLTFLMLSMHNIVASEVINVIEALRKDMKGIAKNVACHVPEVAWFAAKAVPQYMPTVLSTASVVSGGPGPVVQGVCMLSSVFAHGYTKIISATIKNNGAMNMQEAQANISWYKKWLPGLTIFLQWSLQISVLYYQEKMAYDTTMYALLYSCISVLPWGIKVLYFEK